MATARVPQPITDDPVKVDAKHYTVEFENDRVRVVRIKYKAGEKSVMHSHPESIAVFLTDAHAKFTYPDGKSEDIKAKAGSVQHMDAFTHLPENASKTLRLAKKIRTPWRRFQGGISALPFRLRVPPVALRDSVPHPRLHRRNREAQHFPIERC